MIAKVRPARQSDKAPLMSFIKDVWGGTDYIPHVWDSWLLDRQGRMYVVEVDGVPVAMNRVRFLEDGSAWFEGARTHPEHRGQGLASMLGENSMMVAKKRGIRIFRLTSGSHNKAAHRQIARIKFNELARFSVYEPPRRGRLKPEGTAERAGPGDFSKVMKTIRATKEFALGEGMFWHDFCAALLSPLVVRGLIGEGAVWLSGQSVAVIRQGGEGTGIWEEMCFVGGPLGSSIKLVRSLIGREKEASKRFVFVPQRSPLIRALSDAGYERNFSMILYERRVAKG